MLHNWDGKPSQLHPSRAGCVQSRKIGIAQEPASTWSGSYLVIHAGGLVLHVQGLADGIRGGTLRAPFPIQHPQHGANDKVNFRPDCSTAPAQRGTGGLLASWGAAASKERTTHFGQRQPSCPADTLTRSKTDPLSQLAIFGRTGSSRTGCPAPRPGQLRKSWSRRGSCRARAQ